MPLSRCGRGGKTMSSPRTDLSVPTPMDLPKGEVDDIRSMSLEEAISRIEKMERISRMQLMGANLMKTKESHDQYSYSMAMLKILRERVSELTVSTVENLPPPTPILVPDNIIETTTETTQTPMETTEPDLETENTSQPPDKKKRKKKKKTSTPVPVDPSPSPEVEPVPVEVAVEKTEEIAKKVDPPAKIWTRKSKVLLRGLPPATPPDRIKSELEKLNFDVEKIVPFKKRLATGNYRQLPLFLVILPEQEKNKELLQLQHLLESNIKAERFRGGGKQIQCYRCQGFGHTQKNCEGEAACMRCAGGHLSYTCPKPRSDPALCFNCKGPHPACFSGCPERPQREKKPTMPAKKLTATIETLRELLKDPAVLTLIKAVIEELDTKDNA